MSRDRPTDGGADPSEGSTTEARRDQKTKLEKKKKKKSGDRMALQLP